MRHQNNTKNPTRNGSSGNNSNASVKEAFIQFMDRDFLLRKILIYMVNHRVQDFTDPLTNTIVLMATSPLQLMLCESGLLPFKTNLLPVIPYSLFSSSEKEELRMLVLSISDDHCLETMESSGQYTLSLFSTIANPIIICKKKLLMNFAYVIMHNNSEFHDPTICRILCNVILQRFMARVPVSSEIISEVIHSISEEDTSEKSGKRIKITTTSQE